MSLYQIMYISTVTGTVTPDDCATIAREAAVRNRRDNVTGLLLFNSRRFLQVLEGPKDAVERIFARIYDDPCRPSGNLKDMVAALLTSAGPSTSAHFLGSAELHRPAA